MKTIREVFDTVKNHLLTQNARSADDRGSCKYRGDNGTSCAIGCLIPDAKYSPMLEGATCDAIAIRQAAGLDHFHVNERDYHSRDLLLKLQNVHDVHPVLSWPESLDELEEKYFAPWTGLCQT